MLHRAIVLGVAAACLAAAASPPASAAATATVAGGVLTVRGDGGDDQVAISPSPLDPKQVRVEALVTLVNGVGFVDLAGVKSIDVDLGAGSDLLRIGAVGATRMLLTGIVVGDGAGVLDLGVLSTFVKGAVVVTCGEGADKVDFSNVTVTKTVMVETDPRASATGGLDTFGWSNSQAGDVTVFGGDAKDNLTITSTTQSPGLPSRMKRAMIELAGGDDFLSFTNTEVSTSLTVDGGAGNDIVGLLYLQALGTAPPKVKSLEFDFSAGSSSVVLVGSNSLSGTTVGNLVVHGGSGNDTFSLSNSLATGTVTADLGGGADQFNFNHSIVKKAARVDLGAGADQVISTDTIFANSFAADGGADTMDAARLRDGTRWKSVPALMNFEVSEGPAVRVEIHDSADEFDRLVVDLALGNFEVFVDGVSVAMGAATVVAKGASVAVTPMDAITFPFTAKINVAARTGSALVKDGTGTLVLKLVDKDKTF